jgi:hypothetical protein
VNPAYQPFFERYVQRHGAEPLNLGHVVDCLSGWLYRGRINRWEFCAATRVYFHHGNFYDLKAEFDRIAVKHREKEVPNG